nr:MAG TPA: hypothetical protein [Caudoviricetes sp.]
MAALFFYFAKFTKHIMRGIVAQLVEHWSIYRTRGRWFESIQFLFYFSGKESSYVY